MRVREQPETLYARSGDVSIAYQVLGEGPFDHVFVPPFLTHVELIWGIPSFAPVLRSLATYSRLIRFDKRGTGMSDRVSGAPTLETRMDDVRAVMDAMGSTRASFYGGSEGAAMCLLFAATYPERTAALVLGSAYPRSMWAPDYPWGRTEEQHRQEMERDRRLFGPRDEALEAVRSRIQVEPEEEELWLDYFRWSGSPGSVEALVRMNREIDVRHVLSTIRVPTLIIHRTGDDVVPIDVARYMAERIPGARLAELSGTGHLATGKTAAAMMVEERRFLMEVWESGGWDEAEADRLLSTVLFTDIVGASERAASLGDSAWRNLLERHHDVVRRELVRFRGREVDTAGDGFFASFDGPARAIRCACAVVAGVRELGIEVRAGLHTGECELVDGKVAGIAVHTGARVASEAGPGEVLVSGTVKDLVAGSGLAFEDRGTRELKGIPGEWRLFAVRA
jgi:pimeloyl-ACP methyl ester carboxylesterase